MFYLESQIRASTLFPSEDILKQSIRDFSSYFSLNTILIVKHGVGGIMLWRLFRKLDDYVL